MSNKITEEHIDWLLANSLFMTETHFGKCTVMSCQLPNGFVITESSACVDPANYDHALGKVICMEKIKNRIWELEGYKLQCKLDKG